MADENFPEAAEQNSRHKKVYPVLNSTLTASSSQSIGEGNSRWKTSIDSAKHHCRKQRGDASQINMKLPKLIRCIPSMILWWLNHLWLNKPYPGGDRPSVHRYLGKTPLSRSHTITHSSHTGGCEMQVSPTGPSGAPGGNSFVHYLIRASAHPLSHSSI